MKKTLGVLLSFALLVTSAACAASRASSKPEPSRTDSGENWAKAGPSELPSWPANTTSAGQEAELASP
jgi:hypothetical protein